MGAEARAWKAVKLHVGPWSRGLARRPRRFAAVPLVLVVLAHHSIVRIAEGLH